MNKIYSLKKKIKYRSEYRGIKEMDLLLGKFVKKYINLKKILEKTFTKFKTEVLKSKFPAKKNSYY